MNLRTLLMPLLVAGWASSGAPIDAAPDNKAAFPRTFARADLIGSGPVIVSPDVIEGWRFLYRFVTEVEFVLCLEGRRSGDQVYIESFKLARMEAANASSVRYQPCSGSTYVGTAHNHPPVATTKSLCYQSLPDRRSFEADGRAIVDIVLCGEDKFLWVVRDHNNSQQQGTAVASGS